MAITKTGAEVESLKVTGSVITATVRYALSDDTVTDPSTGEDQIINHNRDTITVTNATSAELTAAQSLVSKAAVLAVA